MLLWKLLAILKLFYGQIAFACTLSSELISGYLTFNISKSSDPNSLHVKGLTSKLIPLYRCRNHHSTVAPFSFHSQIKNLESNSLFRQKISLEYNDRKLAGYGFVTFRDEAGVSSALEIFSKKTFNGNLLSLERTCEPSQPTGKGAKGSPKAARPTRVRTTLLLKLMYLGQAPLFSQASSAKPQRSEHI